MQRKLGGDVRFDGVVSGYVYEAKVFGQQSNYVETAISLDWRGLLNARLSVAFDSYGSGHTAAAVELKGRYPVSDVLDLTSGLGVDQMAAVTSYDVAYWELGLRYFCGAHTVVDLRYVDKASTYELLGGAELARFTAAAVSARAVILISIGFLAVANSRPVVHVLDEPRGRMARYIGIEESSWPCRVARGTPF